MLLALIIVIAAALFFFAVFTWGYRGLSRRTRRPHGFRYGRRRH